MMGLAPSPIYSIAHLQRKPNVGQKLASLPAKSTAKIILAKDTYNKNNTKGVVISSRQHDVT